jgi:hypothetical protein
MRCQNTLTRSREFQPLLFPSDLDKNEKERVVKMQGAVFIPTVSDACALVTRPHTGKFTYSLLPNVGAVLKRRFLIAESMFHILTLSWGANFSK